MHTRRTFLARTGSLLGGLSGLRPWHQEILAGRGEADFDLALERAFVHFELKIFENDYLPILQAPRVLDHSHGTPRLVAIAPGERRLAEWRATTRRLVDALSQPATAPLDPTVFGPLLADLRGRTEEFLAPSSHPCFVIRQGRIYWQVDTCWQPTDPESRAAEILDYLAGVLPGLPHAGAGSPRDHLLRQMATINHWYLETVPLLDGAFHTFEFLLPRLAEFAPALPRKVLDRQRMKRRVLHDQQKQPSQRAERLRTLDSRFWSSCLSCSLALVIETLANNHFCTIRSLLNLPEVYGCWNRFTVPFLFRALYRKVEVLRQLHITSQSRESPSMIRSEIDLRSSGEQHHPHVSHRRQAVEE